MMSLRSAKPQTETQSRRRDREKNSPATYLPSSSALSIVLTVTASLANLLPTGTLLSFQLLTPIFTHNGSCDHTTRLMTLCLLLLLATSAFLACFTDSFRHPADGSVYYGFATPHGMWVFEPPLDTAALPDLSKHRLRIVDLVHAALSVLVFATVALRDANVVQCFYPSPERSTKEVLDILPLGIGVICSMLFALFPTTRHGIGYPVTHGGQ